MKIQAILAVTLLTGLGACANKAEYRAAATQGYGYSETKLDENQYTVAFRMRGEDSQQATDYALRRAAELTLKQGKDWFIVTHQNTELERGLELPDTIPLGSSVKRNCGLLGCATTVTYPVGTLSVTTYNETQNVDSLIHIVMGNGDAPEGQDVYAARELSAQQDT